MKPLRQTKDVDIALLVADEAQFYQVKETLPATGLFTAHATETIKLFYKESIELDLLPSVKLRTTQGKHAFKSPGPL